MICFTLRWFYQGDPGDFIPSAWTGEQGCSAVWGMTAWAPCRALSGMCPACLGVASALCGCRMSPKTKSLPADTPKGKHWEKKRRIYWKAGSLSQTSIQRGHTESILKSESSYHPVKRGFAVSPPSCSQSKCFAILPKKSGQHLEGWHNLGCVTAGDGT